MKAKFIENGQRPDISKWKSVYLTGVGALTVEPTEGDPLYSDGGYQWGISPSTYRVMMAENGTLRLVDA
jgi:hypothetical protein